MNWELNKAYLFKILHHKEDRPAVLKISLAEEKIDRFCIGLSLLLEGLIDSMDLLEVNGKNRFRLCYSNQESHIEHKEFKTTWSLNKNELGQLFFFTLKSVRDGISEVDHLDFEIPIKNCADSITDLIICFPQSVPPASANETRRRLNL